MHFVECADGSPLFVLAHLISRKGAAETVGTAIHSRLDVIMYIDTMMSCKVLVFP